MFSEIKMNSLSSSLMLGITLYRNQPGVGKKLIAQAGYALTSVVAAIETVAAVAFSTLSLVVYPASSQPFKHSTKWLNSSAFSLGWAIADCIINLISTILVADEASARKILQSGNIMIIPRGAII